jgi:hypothetical protein
MSNLAPGTALLGPVQLVNPLIVAGVHLFIFLWCVESLRAKRVGYADGISQHLVTLVVNPIVVADSTVAI